MKRFIAWIAGVSVIAGLSFLSGCAVTPPTVSKAVATSAPPVPTHPPRTVLIVAPQTDEGAAGWLKWFERHPKLRLVLAMSPHFSRVAKDPALKARIVSLEKAGRLELALQLPNAPFLPLLIDTNSAKEALPPGSSLPNPPYAYPDDVTQLVARAKADFFRQWNQLPRGLVLPHGAASPKLLATFEHLGFVWLAAALGAPAVDGPYKSGSLAIWDATPIGSVSGTTIHVWDERDMKETSKTGGAPIETWVQEMEKKQLVPVLPSDGGFAGQPLTEDTKWSRRTWVTADWSPWIGSPAKNAAWGWLRRTRAALDTYQNSGRASIHRLDTAFEQFYLAENANFFFSFPNEEREREFKATLATTFRLISQAPPDDLFRTTVVSEPVLSLSSTTIETRTFPNGSERVMIKDASGDDHGDGHLDLQSLEVVASTESVNWTLTFGASGDRRVDIYIDLNNQLNVGTVRFLPGAPATAARSDAWEYALSLSGPQATLYRTQTGEGFSASDTYPVTSQGTQVMVSIPRSALRGSPRRWGFQVLVMAPAADAISDWLDPLEPSQDKQDIIPFVRQRPGH